MDLVYFIFFVEQIMHTAITCTIDMVIYIYRRKNRHETLVAMNLNDNVDQGLYWLKI